MAKTPQVVMKPTQDVGLEALAAHQIAPKVEVVGNPNPTSIENALGLDKTRGHAVQMPVDPNASRVLGPPSAQAPAPTAETQKLAEAQAEIQQLKSERGTYGRETVGPLRADLEASNARVTALEAAAQNPGPVAQQAAPTDPAVLARQMLGSSVDVEDPNVLQLGVAAGSILDATEQGVRALIDPVLEEVRALRADTQGTRALASSGLTMDQVQQAEQAYPQLKGLPDGDRISLIKSLYDASKATSTPAPAAPATANPSNFVEGGGAATTPVVNAPEDRSAIWARRAENFHNLGQDRLNGGGGEAQKNLFVGMLRSGDFTG